MRELFYKVLAWFQEEKGQDMVEYALVTAVLGVGIIAGVVLSPLGAAFTAWVGYIAENIVGA